MLGQKKVWVRKMLGQKTGCLNACFYDLGVYTKLGVSERGTSIVHSFIFTVLFRGMIVITAVQQTWKKLQDVQAALVDILSKITIY